MSRNAKHHDGDEAPREFSIEIEDAARLITANLVFLVYEINHLIFQELTQFRIAATRPGTISLKSNNSICDGCAVLSTAQQLV